MKKYACLMMVLCLMIPSLSIAEDRISQDRQFWYTTHLNYLVLYAAEAQQDPSLHLLWDIPFGVKADDFTSKAKENVNVDVGMTTIEGRAFLEMATKVNMFGYPVRQSFFGFLQNSQSVGLEAGSVTGNTDPVYLFAALRLYNAEDPDEAGSALHCLQAVFDGLTAAYGMPTNSSYSLNGKPAGITPVAPDGSLNAQAILQAVEKSDELSIHYIRIKWGNVVLELERILSLSVSLSFYPAVQ